VTLTAPVGGYVTAREVVQGARVEAGLPLLTITDLSRVRVEADLQEYEAAGVAAGQPATLTLTYDPGPPIPLRVESVYPILNGETRTLKVRFLVDNPGLRLRPGRFATVELPVQSATGVVVPESAVMDTGTRRLVFVEASSGRFEPRAVQVALRAEGRALITGGLRAGERVAVAANFLLDSESRLQSAIGGTVGHGATGHGQ
jgi:RND family efflux transporter MFP subunit